MSAPNAAKSSMNSSENSMKQSVALPAANRPSANGRERCSPRRASPQKNARGIAPPARAVNNVVLSVNHFACNHPSRKGAGFCFGSRMRYRFSRYRFACYRFSRYRFACYRFARFAAKTCVGSGGGKICRKLYFLFFMSCVCLDVVICAYTIYSTARAHAKKSDGICEKSLKKNKFAAKNA